MRRLLALPLLLVASLFHSHQTDYTRMVDRVSASVVRVTIGDAGVCTGEVIAQNRVLTAGHCTPQNYEIRADGVLATVLHQDAY